MLKERKEKMKEIVLSEKHFSSDIYIYRMLEYENLDYLIRKLDNQKVKCYKPFFKKEYLESEEYFVYLLSCFISFFENYFPFLSRSKSFILSSIFENQKNCLFLLTKKSWFDSDNKEYFLYEMKKSIILNTFKTLKISYNDSKIIIKYFKKYNINFDTFNIDNPVHINNLFNAIINITKFNYNHPEIFYLFKNPYIINEPLHNKEEYQRNNLLSLKTIIEYFIKKIN